MCAFRTKSGTIDEEKCRQNREFWEERIPRPSSDDQSTEITELSNFVLAAHTFARKKEGIYPLREIFGYDPDTGEFDANCYGLMCWQKREEINKSKGKPTPTAYMDLSIAMNHHQFLFAYHGVHNPYQRRGDDKPIVPFGLFIKKDKPTEEFDYCHATLHDIAAPHTIRGHRDKYYLLPEDMRELKAWEIYNDEDMNKDFWKYFGKPELWVANENYGRDLWLRTGEFRYRDHIKPENIMAILWPQYIDEVIEDDDGSYMDENLELYTSFVKTFPDIRVISYNFSNNKETDWELTLVNASYYTMRYYRQFGKFPRNAESAKQTIDESDRQSAI